MRSEDAEMRNEGTRTISFSVIVPVYNEEENIPELCRRLVPVMEKACKESGSAADDFEIVLVDDGSRDRSWGLTQELHGRDARIKGLRFSRNFGHHAAVLAGLDYARGAYVILMDGDLQDQPEEIPKLIGKAREGYDIVQGVTAWRHDNPVLNFFSSAFRKVFAHLADLDAEIKFGLFRCLSRKVVDALGGLRERAVFLGGIVSWVGFSTAHVEVTRSRRYAGRAKYNFLRRFALSLNAITSFSERPLIYIFQIGMMVWMMSLVMFGYTVYMKIVRGVPIMGWASIFAAVLFSAGLIILSLSVVGLYISKLFIEIKQRPRYIVREIIQ